MLQEAFGEHVLSTSTVRPNRFGRKMMLCIWWGHNGVTYYELLKPGETVDTKRYQQQMINLSRSILQKRPEYQRRQHNVILLHDNASSHTTKLVRHTLEELNWEVLPHGANSPNLTPSDFHLFASMEYALAEQRFGSYENVQKWVDDWFASKEESFY